jgi:hypothetical protein
MVGIEEVMKQEVNPVCRFRRQQKINKSNSKAYSFPPRHRNHREKRMPRYREPEGT